MTSNYARTLALGALLLGAGCSRAAKTGDEEAAAPKDSTPQTVAAESVQAPVPKAPAAPHIDALAPDSARVARYSVVEVVIRGSGFAPGTPGRNTVELGPIKLNQVPANQAGTEIRFVIPDRYTTNDEAPPRPLGPGTYTVTVHTGVGASNAVSIRILP
ncbi:MAG: hypothetical protein ACT4P6_00205 [Gemmatimonadaceae bacterium]